MYIYTTCSLNVKRNLDNCISFQTGMVVYLVSQTLWTFGFKNISYLCEHIMKNICINMSKMAGELLIWKIACAQIWYYTSHPHIGYLRNLQYLQIHGYYLYLTVPTYADCSCLSAAQSDCRPQNYSESTDRWRTQSLCGHTGCSCGTVVQLRLKNKN